MKTWQGLFAGALAFVVVPAAPVQAGTNLFDLMTGARERSRPPIQGRAVIQRSGPADWKPAEGRDRPARAAPVMKVESPDFYDFQPEPLVAVDFASLGALSQAASLDPQLSATPFRESLAGLAGFGLLAEKPLGAALLDYYRQAPDFIWVSDGVPNARAEAALAVLGEAGSYGLDPADYRVAEPVSAGGPGEAIRFEMALSARVLRYLRDARNGRVDPNKLSGYHDLPVKPFNGRAELARMLRAGNTRLAMEAAHPQMPEYETLRAELRKMDGAGREAVAISPDFGTLDPGGSHPELPKVLELIARGLPADAAGDAEIIGRLRSSELYDRELVPVVEAAQARAGLEPDGVIGPRTVKALAGGNPAERLQKTRLALEQLRWLPRTLGDTRVFINEPAFAVSYVENGAEKLAMRAVVGKTTNQTSFFYDEIEQVDYNPYWGVPQSILVNEMLPRLRRDPGYLDRAGYEVTNAKGRRVASSSVNWGQYGTKIPFDVRQVPSEENALGELKILFPNDHAIYMHDTPQKALFKRDVRAFSHGCVRLERPRDMAAAVLGTTVDHVAAKLAQGHSTEKVTRPIPVYVAYFTAWPDASGQVRYFDDVYQRDAHLDTALEKVEAARRAGS